MHTVSGCNMSRKASKGRMRENETLPHPLLTQNDTLSQLVHNNYHRGETFFCMSTNHIIQ